MPSEKTQTYRVTISRVNSETAVVYEKVKHAWWEGETRFIVSVLIDNGPKHFYWIWPVHQIDHVKIERE